MLVPSFAVLENNSGILTGVRHHLSVALLQMSVTQMGCDCRVLRTTAGVSMGDHLCVHTRKRFASPWDSRARNCNRRLATYPSGNGPKLTRTIGPPHCVYSDRGAQRVNRLAKP